MEKREKESRVEKRKGERKKERKKGKEEKKVEEKKSHCGGRTCDLLLHLHYIHCKISI